jgi:hypothetical protein
LACSGTVLTVGMACLANAALRRPAPLLALAAAAVLAAAAAPDAAALAAVAAVPGALLFALAWALQRLGGTAPSRRNAAAVPMSSASSLTRAAAPSLIISGSAVRGDSVTTARRPSS